jgi:hypothetical protein
MHGTMSELTPPATAALSLRVPRLRLDAAGLLPIAGPVLLLGLFLAAAGPSFVTQDTWVALASGREIVEHGLPRVNDLTMVGGGRPWVDQQWLGQVLLYEASRLGGMAAVTLLWAGACLGGFAIAAGTASRRGASPMLLLATFAVAAAAAPWGMQARTQIFALPLFSLTLFLLLRDPDAQRRSTLWVLPVLCLWANLHGSVVLGAGLVFLYGAQAFLRRTSRGIALCCLASPAILFASPYAKELPSYYHLMLFDPPFGRSVTEWQRTTPSAVSAVFFALAVATLVIVAWRRRRFTIVDLLILGVTLVSALDALRSIVWFGLATLAVVPPAMTGTPRRRAGQGAGMLVGILLLLTTASVVWRASRPVGSYSGRYPQAAADAVQRVGSSPVYADLSSADWLLWTDPSLRGRISYDVRLELLDRGQFNALVAYTLFKPGWRSQLSGYRLAVVDQSHANRLVRAGGWREIYANGTVAVATRTGH